MKKKNRKNKKNNENVFEKMMDDRDYRRDWTKESHLLFFHMYLAHYVRYPIADFQKEIFEITEDEKNKLACITAFRNSAKSTLVTLSYSLWSILGRQQKKFVLIICQTQSQARQHMANIRSELESNKLLKSDLGPFREESGGEWAMSSLVFSNTGARISIGSLDQSIRGLRHHEHRPDLVILDDIEDLNSTKTFDSREKTFNWFTREIIPLGDVDTKVVIVSNLLHEDCLVMRLKKKIDNGELKGIFKWYPLVDDSGKCSWPGKFKTEADIDELRQKVANELAWQQEYLLKIISDSTRVVWTDWLKYYDHLPKEKPRDIVVGVDLAISQSSIADFTSLVTLKVYGLGDKIKAYVLPNPINKRMTFPETMDTIAAVNKSFKISDVTPQFYIESNGFQEIYVQEANKRNCYVTGIKTVTDKRMRLALTSNLIRNGNILFPKTGAEELIAQITDFGKEGHDDLCDGFSIAVFFVIETIKNDKDVDMWIELMRDLNGL